MFLENELDSSTLLLSFDFNEYIMRRDLIKGRTVSNDLHCDCILYPLFFICMIVNNYFKARFFTYQGSIHFYTSYVKTSNIITKGKMKSKLICILENLTNDDNN